jgi:hypothetical protein
MDQKLITEINDYLVKRVGSHLDSRPKMRLVWSTNVTEIRIGQFNDYYGKIFIKTFHGAREVLKYPYDQNRYVLEYLELVHNPELPHSENGSYEPLHVFKDKNGNFLRPNLKVIEIICNALENKPVRQTPSDFKAQEAKEEDDEVKHFEEVLADADRSDRFAWEDSVFLDSTKQKGIE